MSDPVELVLVTLAAAMAVGFSFWIYFRREPPVRGRTVLAVLRALALLLLVLLFWNPRIPGVSGGADVRVPRVLLDASLSMSVRSDEAPAPWETGVQRSDELAGAGEGLLLFGSGVRSVGIDTLDRAAPSDEGSGLAPALERAASLGATSVEVVSDFRLEDPVAVGRVLQATGLTVRSVDVGSPVRNAGIASVEGPGSLPAGEEGTLEVVVGGEVPGSAPAGEEAPGDSVTLDVRVDDRLVASRRVSLPGGGRTTRHRFAFTAPDTEGLHRLRVLVTLPGDVFPADDEWIHSLEVDDAAGGLILLSLRADWEPRYLLPVLEQVTGLAGSGFVPLAGRGWLSMGQGDDRSGLVPEERIRSLVDGAEILVVQGLGAEGPGWIRDAVSGAPRVILLPADASVGPLVDLELSEPRPGEWYVVPEVPASPLAGELSGMQVEGLPPLTDHLRLVTALPSSREPLMARQGQRGPRDPVLALVPGADRRVALILASGLWRWAARDGASRESYRRLWAGLAGWLLEVGVDDLEATVEPVRWPAPRGRPLEWRVRGVQDSLSLRVLAGDSVVSDTTLSGPGPVVRTSALPPGSYRFEAVAEGLPGGGVDGGIDVTGYSAELLHPRVDPPGASGEAGASRASVGAGRPLRTHPAPYLFLILLLCAEWIGRRRQGLR